MGTMTDSHILEEDVDGRLAGNRVAREDVAVPGCLVLDLVIRRPSALEAVGIELRRRPLHGVEVGLADGRIVGVERDTQHEIGIHDSEK